MTPSDHYKNILRYLWEVELPQLHEILPKDLLSLEMMLTMEEPRYELRSGEFIDVNLSELESLSKLVPRLLHGTVLVPFVFQKRKGYWVFCGSKLDQWIVDAVLGFTTCSPFLLESYEPKSYYHQHQVYSFKKRFPSLTILVFTYT